MEIKNVLVQLQQFILTVWRNYQRDHCLQAAGNLAFTTVLSIVPVAIVMSTVLLDFEHINKASLRAQEFLLEKLIPSTAESVREFLPGVSFTGENLTLVSLLFLLVTSVLLLRSIDDTINIIWKLDATSKKSFRLHYYVLVIVLAPILLGLSLSISSFLSSLPYIDVGLKTFDLEYYLLLVAPIILNSVTFTLLYKFSPRVKVSYKHAFIGGAVAAVLFETGKNLFSYYIVSFPNYQLIYGALSFIPIFLLWIYISWAIILFGAEISYNLGQRYEA